MTMTEDNANKGIIILQELKKLLICMCDDNDSQPDTVSEVNSECGTASVNNHNLYIKLRK